MAKTKNQIIEERRARRKEKANCNALLDLVEKEPRSNEVNKNIRRAGLSISKELACCRALFNIVFQENKPEELVKWNEIAENAKKLADK